MSMTKDEKLQSGREMAHGAITDMWQRLFESDPPPQFIDDYALFYADTLNVGLPSTVGMEAATEISLQDAKMFIILWHRMYEGFEQSRPVVEHLHQGAINDGN
jgi:hypothetical protein